MADTERAKKVGKALPIKRHDWETVKAHFIEQTEPVSLRELSEAYGIAYQSVKERSAKERWSYLRAEHQSTVARKAQEDRIKRLLDESEKYDDASLSAAKIGQNLVAGRMAQIASVFAASQSQFNNAVQRLKNGQPVDRTELYSAIRSSELLELANALERFQNVGRKALGTDVQTFNHNVSGEVDHHHELSISEEIGKFDADRMAGFMEAAMRAGLNMGQLGEDILEGEEVDEADQQHQQHQALELYDDGDDDG